MFGFNKPKKCFLCDGKMGSPLDSAIEFWVRGFLGLYRYKAARPICGGCTKLLDKDVVARGGIEEAKINEEAKSVRAEEVPKIDLFAEERLEYQANQTKKIKQLETVKKGKPRGKKKQPLPPTKLIP